MALDNATTQTTEARRDPAASRQKILDAATEEFAAKGYGDARVDEIARRAGLNKRMLYHYFGSKDDLFRAVLEEIYATICSVGANIDLDAGTPLQALGRLVDFVCDYYLANPNTITLLNTENLHRARHLRFSERVRQIHPPFEAMLDRLIARGVKTQTFRPDITPPALYITIVGLVYYYISNNHTLSIFFDRDLLAPQEFAAWRRHVHDVAARVVAPAKDP